MVDNGSHKKLYYVHNEKTDYINQGDNMTKAEQRVLMAKGFAAYMARGGHVTTTKSRKPRKAELLNVFTAFAAGGRWYRGGVASSNDVRYTANNTV